MNPLALQTLSALEAALTEVPPQEQPGLSVGVTATRVRLGLPLAASGLPELPPPARAAALRHVASLGRPPTPALAACAEATLEGASTSDPGLAALRLWAAFGVEETDLRGILAALPPGRALPAVAEALRFGAAPDAASRDRLLGAVGPAGTRSFGALAPPERAAAALVWLKGALARPGADREALTELVASLSEPVARLSGCLELAASREVLREVPQALVGRWADLARAAAVDAARFHAPGVGACQLAMVLRLVDPAEAGRLLAAAERHLANQPQLGDRALLYEALLPATAWLDLSRWRPVAEAFASDAVLRRSPKLFGQTAVRGLQSVALLATEAERDAGLGALLPVARSIAPAPLRCAFRAEAARLAATLPGRSAGALLAEVDPALGALFADRAGMALLPTVAASYAVADPGRALTVTARLERPAHRVLWLVAVADRLALDLDET